MGEKGFENLTEAGIVESDEAIDEDDLVNIGNEINDVDKNSNEEASERVAFTAKVIRVGLELGHFFFLQNDPNVERDL